MFSLSPGSKKKEHPKANYPLDRQGVKEAKNFVKGVTRFLRYNKDLLSEKRYAEIAGLRDEFVQDIQSGKKIRKDFEKQAHSIEKICQKAKPNFQNSVLKENIEVLFVAVVIAMGIRAYFIQQFKIPTGSMQPTLNGIIAYKAPESTPQNNYFYHVPEDYKKPDPITGLIQKVWFGRSHVEWLAKSDGDRRSVVNNRSFYNQNDPHTTRDSNPLILFPRTVLQTYQGHKYSASGTKAKVDHLLSQSREYKKGDVIARGYIETGDMLVVNKMIYHWTRPKRGDVFVFNTRDIRYIQDDLEMRYGKNTYGSQHYIKRLCGLPGDSVQVDEPHLYIDGQPAKEPGIQRVVSSEGLYRGYGGRYAFDLKDRQYLALGDNSFESSDSRAWGHVPEKNIVGKAVFVFYPFGNHFGRID